jgi:hypothetical protein
MAHLGFPLDNLMARYTERDKIGEPVGFPIAFYAKGAEWLDVMNVKLARQLRFGLSATLTGVVVPMSSASCLGKPVMAIEEDAAFPVRMPFIMRCCRTGLPLLGTRLAAESLMGKGRRYAKLLTTPPAGIGLTKCLTAGTTTELTLPPSQAVGVDMHGFATNTTGCRGMAHGNVRPMRVSRWMKARSSLLFAPVIKTRWLAKGMVVLKCARGTREDGSAGFASGLHPVLPLVRSFESIVTVIRRQVNEFACC